MGRNEKPGGGGLGRWLLSLTCFPCKHEVQRSDPGVNAGSGHGGLTVFPASEKAPQSKLASSPSPESELWLRAWLRNPASMNSVEKDGSQRQP